MVAGSVAYCGSVIQWLRDNLGLITDAAESEVLARQVVDNGGVFFVPAFAGLFAPYWRNDARGVIVGMTAFNTKAHLTRAALESAAFQVSPIHPFCQHWPADCGLIRGYLCTASWAGPRGLGSNAEG